MKTLGNILWHIPFMGFVTAIVTFIWGGLLTITVIASPIGLGLIEYSKFLFTPFSHEMISKKDLDMKINPVWNAFSLIIRIVYFPFGLLLAMTTIFQIACLFITIIGIPMAVVLAKSLGTYFNPVNKKCVNKRVTEELDKQKAE